MNLSANQFNRMALDLIFIERANTGIGVAKWDSIKKRKYTLTYKQKYTNALPESLKDILDNGGKMGLVSFNDNILMNDTRNYIISNVIDVNITASNENTYIIELQEI